MAESEINPETVAEAVAPAEAPSADDMLSQMASDEVDQLLTEAENATTPAAADPVPNAVPIEAASEAAVLRASEVSPATESAAVEPPTEVQELDAELAEQSAAVIAEAEAASEAAPLPAAPAAPVAPASADHHASPADPVPAAQHKQIDTHAEDGPPSLLVRILMALNSPMDWLPDPARNAIGKIALATTFNAIALLAYVRFFRHR